METHQVIQRRKEISDAIMAGIKAAEEYNMPYDKYIVIAHWLDMAGYKIVKIPKNARS